MTFDSRDVSLVVAVAAQDHDGRNTTLVGNEDTHLGPGSDTVRWPG